MDDKILDEIRQRIFAIKGDADKLKELRAEVNAREDIDAETKMVILRSIDLTLELSATPQQTELEGDKVAGHKVMAVGKKEGQIGIIGYMVVYKVGQVAVPNEDIENYWTTYEIDQDLKPKPCRYKDAFKNACASMERVEFEQKIKSGNGNGSTVQNIKTYWVATPLDTSGHEYMLTQKVVELIHNKEGIEERDLSHNNVCTIKLAEEIKEIPGKRENVVKKVVSTRIEVQTKLPNRKEYNALVESVNQRMTEQMDFYLKHTTDKKLRDAIRETIRRKHGIPFTTSSGGTWFIPVNSEKPIAQYRQFFKFISENYETTGLCVKAIPLIDEQDTKEQIEQDIQVEVKQRMEREFEKTLKQLSGTDAKDIEDMLEGKLREHGKTVELLDKYKGLLQRSIRVELDYHDIDNVKARGELSGRAKALLRRLRTTEPLAE